MRFRKKIFHHFRVHRIGHLATLVFFFLSASLALAGDFSTFIKINNSVVTHYEYNQRAMMLGAFGASGDINARAKEELIREKLKITEARRLGVLVASEQVDDAMSEYASRFELDTDTFIKILFERGIYAQTFRGFIENSLLWNETIALRSGNSLEISEEEVERAAYLTSPENEARLRLREIVLFSRDDNEFQAAKRFLEDLIPSLKTSADFEKAARDHSISKTAKSGGDIGWISLNKIPAHIAAALITLRLGEISKPFSLNQTLIVFQSVGFEEPNFSPQTGSVFDYAALRVPDIAGSKDKNRMTKIIATTDRCDDLYGYAFRNPDVQLSRELKERSKITPDIARALKRLDPNEFSTELKSQMKNGLPAHLFLMLCNRVADLNDAERVGIKTALFNQRLENLSASYVDELLASAIITYP